MKKLLVFSLLLFLLTVINYTVAQSQTWHRADQVTIAWDAVVLKTDGTALPAGDVVKYDIYISSVDKSIMAKTAENIVTTQYTITLKEEGYFVVGVVAKRYSSTDEFLGQSEFAWTDNILFATDPFGIVLFLPPLEATGLTKVE